MRVRYGRGDTYVQIVDDVLRREKVDQAHGEGEGGVVEEVALDVVQQPGLGEVLDVGEPVLHCEKAWCRRDNRGGGGEGCCRIRRPFATTRGGVVWPQ